jgi:hypothetical protein
MIKKEHNIRKKNPNQNLFDFVLSNYGSLDGLKDFLLDKTSLKSFENIASGTIIETPNVIPNKVSQYLKSKNTVIATGNSGNFTLGDYNEDFSKDYYK